MRSFIVLGNRLNDDASLSVKGLKRCEIALKADQIFHPEKIILSGGTANPKAGISEAKAMYDHLVSKGLDPNRLLIEDRSTDTTENARFALSIARDQGADEVVVISSIEHFGRTYPKNAIACFRDVITSFPEIHLTMYTEEY